jgi:hypothetical protein
VSDTGHLALYLALFLGALFGAGALIDWALRRWSGRR